MTDFAALRSALEAGPTPGPWLERWDGYLALPTEELLGWDHEGLGFSWANQADPTYIAAADPDTIRRLLAAYDERGAALAPLIRLVRDEYPKDLSLGEIAFTWANATEKEMDALASLEGKP